MTNDYVIVIRTRDFKMGPDVENYVQTLKNNGTLDRLSKEGNLNLKSIKNTSLGKMCDMFDGFPKDKMQSGDIIIFGDSTAFYVQTGGSE